MTKAMARLPLTIESLGNGDQLSLVIHASRLISANNSSVSHHRILASPPWRGRCSTSAARNNPLISQKEPGWCHALP